MWSLKEEVNQIMMMNILYLVSRGSLVDLRDFKITAAVLMSMLCAASESKTMFHAHVSCLISLLEK